MNEFNDFLKTQLNAPQLHAVTHKQGPITVIAGAGSGKTRVITARIANLILNENADPSSIVALTFTNKAAGEMKERLIKFLGTRHNLPFVGTFHAYCLLLLRANPKLLQFPKFTILDTDDQKSLIKKIIKKNGLEKQFSAAEISYQISNKKNKLENATDDDEFSFSSQPLFKEIYLAYETEKSAAHNFDFDDLILQVLRIFETNQEFKLSFQDRIEHLLIDEYQDTNMVQHELLKHMSMDNKSKFTLKSISAVGDEDQSIYSWRGAVATNMLKFQKDFAPVTKIKIEQNYRSVQPILEAANSVIKNNRKRTPKKLWSNKIAKNRILNLLCRTEKQEAYTIASFINCYPKDKNLSNIAILYRTHFQSRNLEEALIRNSIPYKIVGGIRFYERREIKDLLAYLRLIINPFDRTSLFRIVNCPPRGLGAKFEEILYEQWNYNSLLDFKQLIDYIIKNEDIKLTPSKIKALQQFLILYKGCTEKATAGDVLDHIIKKTEYLNYLQKNHDPRDAESKIENVKELVQSLYDFESNQKTDVISTLEIFLQEISLMQEKMANKQNVENEIQCMTLHAVKGLEFDTVIVTGLEEGLLPSSRSLNTNKELEEERRLFYVGMTRAKERLLLLHADSRNTYGQITDQVESRFLDEIDDKFLQNINFSKKYEAEIEMFFSKWLGVRNNSSVLTFHDFAQTLKPQFAQKPKTFEYHSVPKKPKTFATPSLWRKNQIVSHKKFGNGIVTNVEKKTNTEYYITANFKDGKKKILSTFLSAI